MATRPKSKAAGSAAARAKTAELKTRATKASSKVSAPRKAPAGKPVRNGNGEHRMDTAAEQSAREVFETLTRWQGEVATAAEKMVSSFGEDPGQGAERFSALLASQREMLDQVKMTLGQFQELLETCEKQLEAQAKEAGRNAGGAKPVEMPLHALQSFQKLALSNIGVWTKIAQDAQGLWLGAMQIWVPKNAAPSEGSAKEEHD